MEKIDWSTLETERAVPVTRYEIKKLTEGVFACPECYGTGRVTVAYRDPGPNKMGQCWTCRGTGEIKKCNSCDNPIPANHHWFKEGLCESCERKHINELLKKGCEK